MKLLKGKYFHELVNQGTTSYNPIQFINLFLAWLVFLCLCPSPYFPRCCFLLAFLKSHPSSAWLRIQPKIWEEIVYRVFGHFVLNFFLFGSLSFESQTLWQPPGPDFYLFSPVNSSLFLSCSHPRSCPPLQNHGSPSPACIHSLLIISPNSSFIYVFSLILFLSVGGLAQY